MLRGSTEDAVVLHEMTARRRNDPTKPPQERDRIENQLRAAVVPSALQAIGDPAIVGPGEAILCERGPRTVSAQAFERRAIGGGDRDTGMEREALGPSAVGFGAADDGPRSGSCRPPLWPANATPNGFSRCAGPGASGRSKKSDHGIGMPL